MEILNNKNNKNYTNKYIVEKIKHRNQENGLSNINYSNNKSTTDNSNDIYNKTYSYLNKKNIALRKEKNKSKNLKKKSSNNNTKINVEKEKENNNINELKINNMTSSLNNNFTNIKTDKIVVIDLKNDINNINDAINKENQKGNELKINERYLKTITNNDIDFNDKIIFKSNQSKFSNDNNKKIKKNNSDNKACQQSNHHYTFKYVNTNKKNILDNNTYININNSKDKIIKKFSNLIIEKFEHQVDNLKNIFIHIDNTENNNLIQRKSIIQEDVIQNIKNSRNLNSRECSYYILSKSPILRFCERMIFSRSTSNLRNMLPKEKIFDENKQILENKILELRRKINLCNKILDTPFTASKTAEITLNFITSIQELEFKDFPISMANEEEKKYYNTYIRILYYLLNEEIEKGNEELDKVKIDKTVILRKRLYFILDNKGYKSIKDYLYNLYIKKNENIREIPKINEINALVGKDNKILEIQSSLKISKFISFSMYIIKEIIKFGNDIKNTYELKIKAKNVIDIISKKFYKYNEEINNK